MDEDVWRESSDVEAMLEALRGRATERQLQAFAAACSHESWVAQFSPGGPFADFGQDPKQINRVQIAEWVGYRWRYARTHEVHLRDDLDIARGYARSARRVIADARPAAHDTGGRLAQFLRCVFANPFRPVSLDPAWQAWNGGTAVKLARTIREDDRPELVPILADALQDAGCGDPDVIAHSRRPLPHAADCWLLGFLLGDDHSRRTGARD